VARARLEAHARKIRRELIPMTARAASKAAGVAVRKTTCKPRANCFKLKEIRKRIEMAAAAVLTCGMSRII
jgi:hypothetical protein